jgi:hypothetical protein
MPEWPAKQADTADDDEWPRPNLSLSKPMIGCTNSMPTMIAMMISTPWSSL